MNRERLSLMVKMLTEITMNRQERELPAGMTKVNKFYLGCWGNSNQCGTTACAIGHAMVDPRFNAMGLRAQCSKFWNHNSFAPKYEGYTSWEAVHKFFEIEKRTASLLFDMGWYKDADHTNPSAVAKRIIALLEVGDEVKFRNKVNVNA